LECLHAGATIDVLFSGSVLSSVEMFDKDGASKMKFNLDKTITRILVDQEGKNLFAISPFELDYIYVYQL